MHEGSSVGGTSVFGLYNFDVAQWMGYRSSICLHEGSSLGGTPVFGLYNFDVAQWDRGDSVGRATDS